MSAGIVFNNLLFTKTEKAVVIRRTDRQELPHLAIFFKTASGEIDGHLKNELAPPGKDPYTPLFRIPATQLREFETAVAPRIEQEFLRLYSKVRKVRPGWLKRKGYVLGITDTHTLTSGILAAAPKLRGKRRVDLEKLKNLFTEVHSRVTLLDPSALGSDELKARAEPILAVRSWGTKRMIGLTYAPWRRGNRAWIISNSIAKEIPNLFANAVPTQTKENIKGVWHRVHDALQLAELGIARD